METKYVVNPKSGRESLARCWAIAPKAVLAGMREGRIKSVKDISWSLLNDEDALQDMIEEDGGEDAHSNFALAVFEHALDWNIGWAVHSFIYSTIKQSGGKKIPKPFTVACFRNGDLAIIGASGKVYPA